MIDTGTATTVREEWPQAVIQVDPVHVVVTETYADSDVDVVCATLDDAVSVTMREGSGAVVQVATDGVVMIATGDVVLLALGVDHEPGQVSSTAPRPSVGSVELIVRAQQAVSAATRSMR